MSDSKSKAAESEKFTPFGAINAVTPPMNQADLYVKENKALRYNNGKLKWSLVDFDAFEEMVRVLEFGAKKYDSHNWKKGLNVTEICESLQRHLNAFLRGEVFRTRLFTQWRMVQNCKAQ